MGKTKGSRESKPLTLPKVILVCGGYIFFACIILILLVTGAGPYDLPPQARALEDAMSESKRLGLPMTQDDLKPDVMPSEEENAASILPLAKTLSYFDFNIGSENVYERQQAEQDFAAALRVENDRLDEIVFALESKPHWYVERDFDLGPQLLLPEYSYCKTIAKWLSTRAKVSALNGDHASALSDINAMYTLSEHLSREPLLISLLVSIAIETIAARATEEIVDILFENESILKALEELSTARQGPTDPRPALRGDYYSALSTARNFELHGGVRALFSNDMFSHGQPASHEPIPRPDPTKFKREGLPRKAVYKAQLASTAQFYNEMFSYIEKTEAAPGWGIRTDKIAIAQQDDLKLSQFMTYQMVPNYSGIEEVLQKQEAYRSMNLALLRVIRFRLEYGRMPTDLEEAGAVYSDPFLPLQNLQALITQNEIRIWSVGVDHINQNGLPRSRDGSFTSDDIAAYWPAIRRKELQYAGGVIPTPTTRNTGSFSP